MVAEKMYVCVSGAAELKASRGCTGTSVGSI